MLQKKDYYCCPSFVVSPKKTAVKSNVAERIWIYEDFLQEMFVCFYFARRFRLQLNLLHTALRELYPPCKLHPLTAFRGRTPQENRCIHLVNCIRLHRNLRKVLNVSGLQAVAEWKFSLGIRPYNRPGMVFFGQFTFSP